MRDEKLIMLIIEDNAYSGPVLNRKLCLDFLSPCYN